jgi:hypothetical protein
MKMCPSCNTIMKQVDEPSQIPPLPQLPADGPPLPDVHRVRHECPKCHHIEAGFPLPSN